jgi:apolipoprotein N-acyltransferase
MMAAAINWVLALLTGGLLVLLFPPFGDTMLAPFALVPLMVAAVREANWRMRFAFGYAAGFVYWFGLTNWIHATLAKYGGVGPVGAWALFALLCLAKAVQMGAFSALARPVMGGRFGIPALAALWVAIEWTQVHVGFEWLNLGNAGSAMSVLARLAPVTGVWGLSFAFALMSAVIAGIVLRRRLVSVWLLGFGLLGLLPGLPAPERGYRSVIAVQPNLDDDTVWSPELIRSVSGRLAELSLSPAFGRRADFIVWPEMPLTLRDGDPDFALLAAGVTTASGAALLTGGVSRGFNQLPYNSAILVGPDGRKISRYDKVNLVPFGEYVPGPFEFLVNKISNEAGDYRPGDRVVVSAMGGHRSGTFICYEAVYPDFVRRFALGGAEVLFNISNDSWAGSAAARHQHLEVARMRAAENRRWLVRVTNDGVTAAIDPAGRIAGVLPEAREAAARMRFSYRSELTFYTRFGDWFVGLCAVGALVSLAAQCEALLRRIGLIKPLRS